MYLKKTALIIPLLVLCLCSCQEQGPLESAGERADEIKDNIVKGKPPLHKPGPLEKAGEAIDDAVRGNP